jgi:hypothetical protein
MELAAGGELFSKLSDHDHFEARRCTLMRLKLAPCRRPLGRGSAAAQPLLSHCPATPLGPLSKLSDLGHFKVRGCAGEG